MSSAPYSLSNSVIELKRSLDRTSVSAGTVLNMLFEAHPEYGGGLAGKVRLPEARGASTMVDDWVEFAASFFRFESSPELHGRLMVIGLALLSPAVRDHLIRTGLLQAVAAEIQEGVPPLLTPEARKKWEIIESRWHDSGAISITPADPPAKSPERTQSRIPDPTPSPPPASAARDLSQSATPASSAAPATEEPPQSSAAEVSQAPSDGSDNAPGYEWDHSQMIWEDDQAALVSQFDSSAAAEVIQDGVEEVAPRNAPPTPPSLHQGELGSPPVQSRSEETVPAHPDDPAALDTLARRPFARCIANRMDEVWKGRGRRPTRRGEADTGSGGAFMLHLHGPWGSGKSSILNFLRDELQGDERPPDERWVVVEFNAWRHQRIRPPWWALIRDVYAQSARQLPFVRGSWLRVRWWAWRVRADWLPVAAAAALITVAVLVISGVLKPEPAPAEDAAWKGVELALKLLTGALAAWGTVFAVSRSLAFGSARAAQAYTELKSDPLGPIVRLFERLTASIRRPVAVFIDDLDRCDGKYVVELLEGVQTLFRTAPVTYVVAADRKWICASFQQGYKDFGDEIGEAGRPLGYLFLDKLFQVSASVPRPAPEVQRAYWSALLRAAGTADAATLEARRQQAEAVAEREVGNRKTTEALQAFVQAAADPVEQEGRRAVAAQRITTPEAQRETQKHLLEGFADLLEPNPRSMKRLVNAYGLHQATHFLEHRHVSPDALARWTLIELRWPLLADHLASHPETLASIGDGAEPAGVPDALKPLFGDDAVRDVVRGGAAVALDEAALRQIVGSVDGRRPERGGAPGDADAGAEAAVDDPAAEGGVEEEGADALAVQTQG